MTNDEVTRANELLRDLDLCSLEETKITLIVSALNLAKEDAIFECIQKISTPQVKE